MKRREAVYMKHKIFLEEVFSEENLSKAIEIVVKKNSAPGMDNMSAKELPDYWRKNKTIIMNKIHSGQYYPIPFRIYFKSKSGKKEKRKISICSAKDQMLQHCLRFEIEQWFVPVFHNNSYGFIKNRNTAQALQKCLFYMNNGLVYVVDSDIKKCFDSIDHQILLNILEKEVSDKRVLRLIGRFLKNPGLCGKDFYPNDIGVPQGSSLSPLLANIVLNQLDWYLENRSVAFVRYADDLVLFCETEEKAKRAMEELKVYLRKRLLLTLNMEKTSVCSADKLEFLGHSFCKLSGIYQLSLNENIIEKIFVKMERMMINKKMPIKEKCDKMGSFNRGILNYYCKVNEGKLTEFMQSADDKELEYFYKFLVHKYSDDDSADSFMKEILSSESYVTFLQWYDELKERRVTNESK